MQVEHSGAVFCSAPPPALQGQVEPEQLLGPQRLKNQGQGQRRSYLGMKRDKDVAKAVIRQTPRVKSAAPTKSLQRYDGFVLMPHHLPLVPCSPSMADI